MERPEDVKGQIEGTETADEERDDEMTAELTGWKHELVLVEGRESTEDGGKRLKTATAEGGGALLKLKEEVNQTVQ